MPADLETEYGNLVGELIPPWFFSLSAETRNVIIDTTKAQYFAVTDAKNATYVTYFNAFIAPYEP